MGAIPTFHPKFMDAWYEKPLEAFYCTIACTLFFGGTTLLVLTWIFMCAMERYGK